MSTKTCKLCGEPFSRDPRASLCEPCRIKSRRKTYRTRDIKRDRQLREKRDPKFLAKRVRIFNRYASKPENQAKIKARSKIKHLVRTGQVKRLPCERCGAPNTHAHHDDYGKPLDVRWLCPPCHTAEHQRA